LEKFHLPYSAGNDCSRGTLRVLVSGREASRPYIGDYLSGDF